jgi:hypothetical protein
LQQPAQGVTDFGAADGVPEGNGGFPNVWLDRAADRLWAATVDGVVAVDLSRFPLDTAATQIRIDDVRIDGAAVALADALVIPPSASALQIRFTAPSFGGHDALHFRYRLRGHDRDWIESGSGRVARYGNLAPGRYTFEVQALDYLMKPVRAERLVAALARAERLRHPQLERAIGVIYRPESERQSHYFTASLADQFDAIFHYDQTRAVEPMERTSVWEAGEVDETYPSGL